MVLLVALYIILHFSWVQEKIGHAIADVLANAWDTEVRIDRLEMVPLSNFVFHDFFIRDHDGDTLIYAKRVEADNYNVFALFQKTIEIGNLNIKDAVFKVQRRPGAEFFNIHFLIAFFENKAPKKSSRPKKFKFSLGGAQIERARVHLADTAIGTAAVITCDTGYVTPHNINGVDMISKYVWGERAHLSNANIHVKIFDPVPIPNVDSSFGNVPVDSTIPTWDVGCEKFILSHVDFRLTNHRSDVVMDSTRTLDFANLHFEDINLETDTFRLQHEVFTGHVRNLSGANHGGFEVKHFAGDVLISPYKLDFQEFILQTNESTLGDQLTFTYNRYPSFYEFVDKVKMQGRLNEHSVVTFRDISAFAPKIAENVFIGNNLDHPIYIKGKFKGTVNNLRVKTVSLRVLDSYINGSVSLNDITTPQAAFLDLQLKRLQTNYSDLKTLLPFVQLPHNIARMGSINFDGSYIGYFEDFEAKGTLNTGIGIVESDLIMNLRAGIQKASYKGGLVLDNFHLGKFLNQPDLGRLSVQAKVEGQGLTLETLNAHLYKTKIDSFTFKDYQYKDVLVDGQFEQLRFDGDILSKDANLDIFVRGIVDLNGDLPSANVLGNINNIDFQALNITPENITLHTDTFAINASGNTIDNFTGHAFVRGIRGNRGTIHSYLDEISLRAVNYPQHTKDTTYKEQTRTIVLNSDVLDLRVSGQYDVVNLIRSIEQFIKNNHPNLYRELYKMPHAPLDSLKSRLPNLIASLVDSNLIDSIPHQSFNISLEIPTTTRNLTQLIDTNFHYLSQIDISGKYDDQESNGYLQLSGHVGAVSVGHVTIEDIHLKKGRARGRTFDVETSVEMLQLNGRPFIPEIDLTLDAIGDSVRFLVQSRSVGEIAQALSINGQIAIKENQIVLELDTSSLYILEQKWTINANNSITIGQEVLGIENVILTSDNKRITVSSINHNRGAHVEVDNISLGWLYSFMKPIPQITIDGVFSGEASMQNVFNQKGISAHFLLDTLEINNDYWGSNSTLTVKADSLKSIFQGKFMHQSSFMDSLAVNATFTPAFATTVPRLKNFLDINISLQRGNAIILEYFIGKQVSETEGMAFADMRIFGNLKGQQTVLNTSGKGRIIGMQTKINFLQTKYILDDADIKIDNTGFHLVPNMELNAQDERISGGVGFIVEGEPNKKAYLDGSLTHNHLKNFGLDARAAFKNNLMMNTVLDDNDTFYGTVYASGLAEFRGPFERLKLTVDARTEEKTIFNLPLGGPLKVSKNNYIKFIDKNAQQDSSDLASTTPPPRPSGLEIEIIADIRPSAVARLIIDESAGDVIEGRGNSERMRVLYTAEGDLKIFGTYVIESGNYLFTYKNIINKPFDVKKGGTITWGDNDGSPFEARLNIQAAYLKNLGVANLVKSYIVNEDELLSLANQPCRVELLMDIKGALFEPDINFNINITDVPQRLINYVNLAQRTIHADKNELNRQVFGIIALQQFLPLENNNVNVVSSGISTGISTVSELVSQQLSLYINDLLAGVVKDVGFISSLEFDLNFNIRDSENQTIRSTTSNVRLGGDVKFLDDRLRIYAGANLDITDNNNLGLQNTNPNYIGGDFIAEYFITDDGRFRVKVYNRSESTILGPSNRRGIGISYRKQFDSIQELIEEGKKARKSDYEQKLNKREALLADQAISVEAAIKQTSNKQRKQQLKNRQTRILRQLQRVRQKIKQLPKTK